MSCAFAILLLSTLTGCSSGSAGSAATGDVLTDKYDCLALAFAPDGHTIAVGGVPTWAWSYQVELWSVAQKQNILTIPALGSPTVAFSADGSIVATGTWTGEVSLWEVATGKRIASVPGHSLSVVDVEYSPDGNTVATACEDSSVKLWTVSPLSERSSLHGHTDRVNTIAFSPDSKSLITGSCDHTIRRWNAVTGESSGDPIDCQSSVRMVSFSPDGKTIGAGFSSCTESGIGFWNADSGDLIKRFADHMDFRFAKDSKYVAVGTNTNATVTVWNLEAQTEAFKVIGNRASHYTLSFEPKIGFSPDDASLAIGVQGMSVHDSKTGQSRTQLLGVKSSNIEALAYSSKGQILFAYSGEKGATLIEPGAAESIADFKSKLEPSSVQISPDGKYVVLGAHFAHSYGTIDLFSTETRKRQRSLRGHTEPVTAVTYSRDGERIASADRGGRVRLWDAATGDQVGVLPPMKSTAYSLAFLSDRQLAVAGNGVHLWDFAQSKWSEDISKTEGLIYALSVSSDGEWLAIGGQSRQVWLRKSSTGTTSLLLHDAKWPIRSLTFSADSKTLVVAGGPMDHGVAEIWDVVTGQSLHVLRGHKGPVTSTNFSSNGSTLLTGSSDGSVIEWNSNSGKFLSSQRMAEGGISSIAVSPDGLIIAAGSSEGVRLRKSQ